MGEGLLIFLAVTVSATFLKGMDTDQPAFVLYTQSFLITFICQICLYYNTMYDLNALRNNKELISRLVQALGGATIILSGIHLWIGHGIISNPAFILSLLMMVLLVMSWRFIYTLILRCRLFDKTILFVGNSPLIRSIILEITSRKDSGYHIIHVLPDYDPHIKGENQTIQIKAACDNYDGLSELAKDIGAQLIVSDKDLEGCKGSLEHELLKCRINGVRVMDGNSFFEMITGKLHVNQISPCWLIFSEGFNRSFLHHTMTIALDYSLSIFLLLLLMPLILVTAILIKLDSRGPVFYSQSRMGKGKKNYNMYKFRTMVWGAEKKSGPLWSKAGDTRITWIGKYLRNYRIDEIPQLWNVLKGDMSFVGPRPEREFFVNQLEKSIPYYGIRFTVKPGITGWAQVNYGYGSTEDDAIEKLNYDLYYIKNSSVLMDIFIVFKTTKTVILGVESQTTAPVESMG